MASTSKLILLLAASCCTVSSFLTSTQVSRKAGMSITLFLDESKQIDVSDLGLTMDDLNAPLPDQFLEGIETSGYESTSRISSVQDDACMWIEESDTIKATLAIPGLRGQPAMCLSVLTATNTISITAFGRVVWSCILRGNVRPETASFEASEGSDMIPIISFEVKKSETEERWGGFILQIGEDSIL